MAYPIKAAIDSQCFDEVMVSTDDEEIADVARKYGAKVPFMRSAATSNDYAGTSEVLYEVLREYEKISKHFDYGCCLYPTAPLISPQSVRDGYQILLEKNASAVFTVAEFSPPIWWALDIQNERIQSLYPQYETTRSQDLKKTFYDAGQFYWFKVGDFLRDKKLMTVNVAPLVLPASNVQDIDTEEDWVVAEQKYAFLKKQNYT